LVKNHFLLGIFLDKSLPQKELAYPFRALWNSPSWRWPCEPPSEAFSVLLP